MSNEPLSLEERLTRLAATDTSELPDFPDDKSDLPSDFEYNPEDYEDQEEEIVEEISENELLKYLDQQESPLAVAQRLFYRELNSTESQSQSETLNFACLTPKALQELYGTGWTEIEGLIDLDTLKGAYQEAEQLRKEGKFLPARAESDQVDQIKRDDTIVWFTAENNTDEKEGIVKAPQHLKSIVDFIEQKLHRDVSNAIQLNGRNEYQLSHYAKGARFERHRDGFPTDDPQDQDQRRVTVIIHLSSEWTSEDGGELKICSHVDQEGLVEGADRILQPTLGRIFIGLSGAVDYEMLVSNRDRYSFTAWFR